METEAGGRLHDLPEVKKLVSGRTGIASQIFLTPKSELFRRPLPPHLGQSVGSLVSMELGGAGSGGGQLGVRL